MSKKKAVEVTFRKEELRKMTEFSKEKDIITALLEDEKLYTMTEVKTIISDFKKRKVWS